MVNKQNDFWVNALGNIQTEIFKILSKDFKLSPLEIHQIESRISEIELHVKVVRNLDLNMEYQ